MKLDKLILVDPNQELCAAWEKAFKGEANVEIRQDRFENIQDFDCMVSAANSFGLMDGGVDLAIRNFFGLKLENAVQKFILDHFFGEQPVGTSFIIETGHPLHPYLAHTPTMRVPMNIAGTDFVYSAMRAMLLAVSKFNRAEKVINKVVCPGLGASTGRVPIDKVARQMALAYASILNPPKQLNWKVATQIQNAVKYGRQHGDGSLRNS